MRIEKGRFWNRYNKVQQAESTATVNNSLGKLYVILVGDSPDNAKSFIELNQLYDVLIRSRVDVSTISILKGNSNASDSASRLNLERELSQLRKLVSYEDKFLFYIATHGTFLDDGSPGILLPNKETITPLEFTIMASDMPYNYGIFYFGNCLGGEFAEAIGYHNNIGISPVQGASKLVEDSFETAKKKAKRIGAINYIHPDKGDHFANDLFYFLFDKKLSIERAFDRSVEINATILPMPYACPGRITPQLRWQNADPAQLYLN